MSGMPTKAPDTKTILWQNVRSLMLYHYKRENLNQLVRDTKIGPGSASRLKAAKTSVGLDTLEKISKRFELQPWHLLLPNLDPSNPPVAMMTETEVQLYRRLKRAHNFMIGQEL